MVTKNTQLACLCLGYDHYLLPLASAMKVAELMASAVCCEKRYEDGFTYRPTTQPEVTFELVPNSKVTMPMPMQPAPKRARGPKLIKG